ncbi:hypothetical protein [Caldibacillus debilis]|uniref:hypothetical protein n=1 Tax=Caldibacillus debilis TaxID=301148 RepID=UPI000371029B|nr:hypothetical protein [Caldibacillus debilis]
MKRNGELDELIEHFTFLPNEMQQVGNKSGGTRLGFAVLFDEDQDGSSSGEGLLSFQELKLIRVNQASKMC